MDTENGPELSLGYSKRIGEQDNDARPSYKTNIQAGRELRAFRNLLIVLSPGLKFVPKMTGHIPLLVGLSA